MTSLTRMMLALGAMTVMAGCGHHGDYHHGHGGGSGEAVERGTQAIDAAVDKAVADPEKARQVKATINEIVDEAKQSYKASRDYHQKLYELNTRYDAAPEEFTRVLDDLNNSRARTGAKILVSRFKMKDLLTAEEWKNLIDNLNAARMGYMHGHGTDEGGKGKGGY